MKVLTLKLTMGELKLLTSLASEQLFREEFINLRIPGHRSKPEEIALGKSLVARLQLMARESPAPSPSKRNTGTQLRNRPVAAK